MLGFGSFAALRMTPCPRMTPRAATLPPPPGITPGATFPGPRK
jgi:hypothetical protein